MEMFLFCLCVTSRIILLLVMWWDICFVVFRYLSVSSCSTMEHCTWAPNFTSCWSETENRGKRD